MNKVLLTGNVVRDAETYTTKNDNAKTTFSLAINGGSGANRRVTYVPIAAWNEYGKKLAEYAKKGARLLIEGEISQQTYDKDGKKQTVMEIIVNHFESFAKRGDEGVPAANGEEEV